MIKQRETAKLKAQTYQLTSDDNQAYFGTIQPCNSNISRQSSKRKY